MSNMIGQVLHQSKYEGQESTTLNVDRYPQGTYILEVYTEDGRRKKTFKVEVVRE